MPRMDGTGPYGTGPVGRGLGPCGGGLAFCRGGRWGMGRGYWPETGSGMMLNTTLSEEERKALLEKEETLLQARIELVKKELEKITKPEKK